MYLLLLFTFFFVANGSLLQTYHMDVNIYAYTQTSSVYDKHSYRSKLPLSLYLLHPYGLLRKYPYAPKYHMPVIYVLTV